MTVDELIARFEVFDDWEERYLYLMDLGRKLPAFDESWKTEENLVEGCVSQVWLVSKIHHEPSTRVEFRADSDSQIVKGLVSILIMLHSNQSPADIISHDIDGLFTKLGLTDHLSPSRKNGFYAMIRRLRALASTYVS
ncbi:MAG: cysteine desulfuration protein SufE [Myxococcales bacterium]|nr:cysteine desulfuration protein SufE [Myxococcales bacterium]